MPLEAESKVRAKQEDPRQVYLRSTYLLHTPLSLATALFPHQPAEDWRPVLYRRSLDLGKQAHLRWKEYCCDNRRNRRRFMWSMLRPSCPASPPLLLLLAHVAPRILAAGNWETSVQGILSARGKEPRDTNIWVSPKEKSQSAHTTGKPSVYTVCKWSLTVPL